MLVVSLLVQNPTSVSRKETTTEPAPGVITRAHSRRIAAAAAALPEEILVWEILIRLPAKDILRYRAVCRSWHGLTSAPDFLLAHHKCQPLLPIFTSIHGSSSLLKGYLSRLFKGGLPVLEFDDYEGFQLLASCDGLLLVTLSNSQHIICNPTTRQSASLPCLSLTDARVAALYLHRPSGEHRVLYVEGTHWHYLEAGYNILTVRQGQPSRCIGVPADTPGIEEVMRACHIMDAKMAPPVLFRDCLHWDSDCRGSHAGILVFDTLVESFRLMRRPTAATRFCRRLCNMEGSIGFSCNYDGDGTTAAKIWVLEDYDREVWSFKYHVKFPVESLCYAEEEHLVLSHKGDVLVYTPCTGYMFHCDNTGKLLEEFQCNSEDWITIEHWFKESLVKHDIFLMQGCVPFFQTD
jgi:F-box interacting protein